MWMIATREQSFSTSCIEWVEKTIVLPWSRSSAIFCRTTRATRTSSPEVGSSKIRTGGSWTIVRAIETFCFIPVDIFEPRMSRKSFIWSQSKIVSIRSRSRSRGQSVEPAEILDQLPGGHPVVDAGAGRHVADARPDLLGLGHHVVPGHDRAAAGRPEHGAQDPQGRRLARPVGPEQAEDRAGLAVEADVANGRDPAPLVVEERLAQVFDVDHAIARTGDRVALAGTPDRQSDSRHLTVRTTARGTCRWQSGLGQRQRAGRLGKRGLGLGVDVLVEDVPLPGDVAGLADRRLICSSER